MTAIYEDYYQQIDSCISVVEDDDAALAEADADHDHDQQQQLAETTNPNSTQKLETAAERSASATATDESVSSSSFTNSTSASINSRTTLGVKNNQNSSSSSNPQQQQQHRRVLAFQLDGMVVHQRRSSNNSSKNPIQMLTNLFSSMMGERGAKKYGVKRQILQRTRSSLRKPQLVSVRSRGSVHQQKRDKVGVVTTDNDTNTNDNVDITTKSSSSCENAFTMLLRFCDTPADIAFLRSHPDHLERLGIPVEQYSTILEELNFFLIKREQLREAEQRVHQRKQKREKNN